MSVLAVDGRSRFLQDLSGATTESLKLRDSRKLSESLSRYRRPLPRKCAAGIFRSRLHLLMIDYILLANVRAEAEESDAALELA